MTFVTLNRIQLKIFIESNEFRVMPFIPISYLRANSHINNPRAEENDILLILAYNENDMVGYLGIIPDMICKDNKFEKIGWLSCLWIHPRVRGKGVAKALAGKAVELWNNRLLISDFAPVSLNLFQNLDWFDNLIQKNGLRIYRRSCLHAIIPIRKPKIAFLSPLLKVFDVFINLFNDLFLRKTHRFSSQYSVEFPLIPDESCYYFMNNLNKNELIQKGQNEMDWFFQYPWIKETPISTTESKRYQFSSEARKFKFLTVKIKQNIEIVVFLIVTVREKQMKTPYVYIKPGHEAVAVETLNNLMCEHNIEILTTYNKSIRTYVEKNIYYLFSKNLTRKYLQSKGFNLTVNEAMFQDGDGDCGFV